jgi:hypothetical protein
MSPAINGTVTVKVNGKDYAVAIVNGKGNLTVSGLANGTYDVNVTFAGDDKYVASNDTATLKVNKVDDYVIDVTAQDITFGENETIVIVLPADVDATQLVVKVDGIERDYTIVNGVATVVVPNLAGGTHMVNVTYKGDDKYNAKDNNGTLFKVNPTADYDIEISVLNDTYGKDTTFIVVLPEGAEENVTITIDGSEMYSVKPNSDGVAILTLNNISAGSHTVTATYPGDYNYQENSDSTEFFIDKATSSIEISVNDVYVVDEDIIINITVKNSTGDITVRINGKEYNVTGEAVTIIGGLANGTYIIEAVLAEDQNYSSSVDTATFEVNKLTPEITATNANITVGKDAVISITGPEDRTGGIVVEVDGTKYYANMTDGEAEVTIKNLATGEYSVKVTYIENDKYVEANADASITVNSKIDPSDLMNVTIDVGSNNNATVTVELPENATGNITVVVDGKEYDVTNLTNGTAVIKVDDLAYGNHTIEVIYSGDDNYSDTSKSKDIEVPQVSDYELTVSAAVDINSVDITVILPDDITGPVLIDVNGVGYYANATGGEAKLHLDGLSNGLYEVIVTYPGDEKYTSKSNSTTFVIDAKVTPDMDIVVDIPENATTGTITVTLPENATGNITVIIDGKEYAVTNLTNGTAVIEIEGLPAGNHTAEIIYSGDDHYNGLTNYTTVEIPRISDYDFEVIAEDILSGEPTNITVILPEDVNGVVLIDLNGVGYYVNVTDGVGTFNALIDLASGTYDVRAYFQGDDKYANKSATTSFNVDPNLIITAPDVVKYYHGTERLVIYFKDENGNNVDGITVKIIINGVTYSRTSENGEASIALNLNSGNYSIDIVFDGDGYYKPQNITANVEILPTIYANDVFKAYKNGTQYYALFVDSEGNPLVNTDVSFNINGVFYTKTTNESGWAKLNINLAEGEYILTAINPVTGEMRTNTVTVISLIESSDLTKHYMNDSQFIVRVRAADGSWAKAGEQVTFNINGVFYNRTTNESGYVKLSINLSPGEYVITTYYKDCRESNNITVLPRLITSDMTMKYGDGSKFVVTTLDEQGNPAANQEVSFNINGILYSRTTNDQGEAGIGINLRPGEYIITSEYNSVGEREGNTIKIEA